MKKIFNSIIFATLILAGCSHEIITVRGVGSLELDLNCNDYTDVVTRASQTDEDIINNLVIDIVPSFGGNTITYPAFSEIRGKVIELGSGNYTITASSPEKLDAAFDQPIFSGTKDFTIKTGEVTSFTLDCGIGNVMVTILLAENFVKELTDYRVTVSNGKGTLVWSKNSETNDFEAANLDGSLAYKGKQDGFFTVAPLTVRIDGHRGTEEASTVLKINNVNPGENHIITIDAEVTGTLDGIEITIDKTVKPISQNIVVPGFPEMSVPGDEPEEGGDENEGGDNGEGEGIETPDTPVTPSTVPTITWAANPTFADMDLPLENAVVDVTLEIEVPELIKEFLIYVESPQLTNTIAAMTTAGREGIVDGVATMDMINDDKLTNQLTKMGLDIPVTTELLDQSSVTFSLSTLIPLINLYKPAEGDRHIFTLNVTDGKGQLLEKTITFVSVAAE